MKCLIAITPTGGSCFVSDLCEGSIDDVSIFEQSGILNSINPGDTIMVDRGFTVQHLLAPKQATIFIPPFLSGHEKLSPEETMLTKEMAKARIHVKRFNERLKKFRLLDQIIPLSLAPMASQLVYVASCLVNFQDNIRVQIRDTRVFQCSRQFSVRYFDLGRYVPHEGHQLWNIK